MRELVGRGRSDGRIALAIAVLCTGALLALTGSAHALSQRGYSFGKSFGEPGSGAGQLKSPAGIAVSQKNGDIYVVDSGNNRVDRFDSAGAFVEAWGFGVKTGAKALQHCTTTCQVGLAGHKEGQLDHARDIAIDNNPASPSYGDVYVQAVTASESFEYGVIAKYDESGSLIEAIKGYREPATEKGEHNALEKWEEEFEGLTVNPAGDLLVYNETSVIEFNNAVENAVVAVIPTELDLEEGEGPRPGIAVDGHEDLYLGTAPGPSSGTNIAKDLVAEENGIKEGVPALGALDPENSTGVAVDLKTENVLVDNGTSVAWFDSQGELLQRFGNESANPLQAGTGVAAIPDAGEPAVSDWLVADAGAGRIELFVPEAAGAPLIDAAGAAGTTPTTVELNGLIDPHGSEKETEYRFRYSTGVVPAAAQACVGACIEVPAPAGKLAGSAGHFGDLSVPAQTLTGLSPSTAYNYRLIASNDHGVVESAELKFKTRPSVPGEALPDHRAFSLVSPIKKNGGYIDAMPAEGGNIQSSEDGSAITYVSTAATEGSEGNRSPETDQLLSVRRPSPQHTPEWATTNLQTPYERAEGFVVNVGNEYRSFTGDLSSAFVRTVGHEPLEYPKLSPEASERTPYERQTFCSSPAPCFTPMITPANVTFETEKEGHKEKPAFGASIQFLGANSSNQTAEQAAVSEVFGPLTTEMATELAEKKGKNLYEWTAARPPTENLQLVSVLPNGTAAEQPQLGFQNQNLRNAISADGSRVVWSSGEDLYVRMMGLRKTVKVDTAAAGVEEKPGAGKAVFQSADTTDTEIFFTDERPLTTNASAGPKRPDLYVCQIEHATTEPTCRLTDLSADPNVGESASVQGIIPGAAADGSDVFFVADGALSEHAPKGNCFANQDHNNRESQALLSGTCNLYAESRSGDAESGTWGAPKLVATLSVEDEPDWFSGAGGNLRYITDRVSPNGEWFAFMSDRELTGYNNHDLASGRPDEEVYLYNAVKGSLVCSSCDPTGARPHGIKDVEESGEGIGLLIDRTVTWENRWLAASVPGWTGVDLVHGVYQSRYLSNSGRLFFNSAQSLVPQDHNRTQDVYEFAPEGVLQFPEAPPGPENQPVCTSSMVTFAEPSKGCISMISGGTSLEKESAFLDASNSGNDVFFDTAAQLSTLDTDNSFDVYDAGVCGVAGAPECVPQPPPPAPLCAELGSCRGPESHASLGADSTGSLVASGTGNTSKHEVLGATVEHKTVTTKPLTRAQKYAKALKVCKRIRNKHKRTLCLHQAKKKYGPLGKRAKKSSHGTRGR